MNSRFIKKIPPGSEVVNLLVGEIEELHRRVAALVRLKVSCQEDLLYVIYDSASLHNSTNFDRTAFLQACFGSTSYLLELLET